MFFFCKVLSEHGYAYSFNIDFRNELHSFGLIIVALIANLLWKPGGLRGTIYLGVTLLSTYILIRYGLMEYTNFTISNIGFMYEDIASSILASPKAYIILVISAYIASRMNIRYGWEFNGILIPSLLALQWYSPFKLLVTFIESFVIVAMARALFRLRFISDLRLEGARLLLFFFTLGYLYKYILTIIIIYYNPTLHITDLYGFGYLTATLLAIKMYEKDMVTRMTRATLQTSLIAVIISTFVGYGITLVPNYSEYTQKSRSENNSELAVNDITDWLLKKKVDIYGAGADIEYRQPIQREIDTFSYGTSKLLQFIITSNNNTYSDGVNSLASIDFKIINNSNHIIITDAIKSRGWGTYIINKNRAKDMNIQVPASIDERGTFESGLWLYLSENAQSLAISGASRRSAVDLASDPLLNRNTIFYAFQQAVGNKEIIQIRGLTSSLLRKISGVREEDIELVDKKINKQAPC